MINRQSDWNNIFSRSNTNVTWGLFNLEDSLVALVGFLIAASFKLFLVSKPKYIHHNNFY